METQLQPVHKTKDGFFNTASHVRISIHDPKADMINMDDIASALSKICRFGGNIPEFYSVAQHTLMVVELAPDNLKKTAFLHDCSEAYLGDVIKPLKHIISESYTPIERRFENLIYGVFKVPMANGPLIKDYDMLALTIEHEYFRGINTDRFIKISKKLSSSGTSENCWNPVYAKNMFLKEFERLFN